MFYLLCFWCSTLHLMKSEQHFLYKSGKGRILDKWRAMICSYIRTAFLPFLWRWRMLFKNLAKTAYFCSWMDWLLTSRTLKITNPLNLNESQCYHHFNLSMIKGFHGFVVFSLSLSKINWIMFSSAKETLQMMLAIRCSYRDKHMKDWK